MHKRNIEFYIWEGIYKSFQETGVKSDLHNDAIWAQALIKKLKEILRKNEWFCSKKFNQDALLSFLVSTLSLDTKKLNIIDFGGGIGINYIQILNSVQNTRNINFYIVEKEVVCKAGSEFFKKDEKIKFFSSMPKLKKVDLVYLRSSLQYIDDWKGLLRKLSLYKPRFFFFVDLFVGCVPTYVTVQNYYDDKIPCRFININEFLKEMNKLGFEILFKSNFDSMFLGEFNDFPQSNFPVKYRIKNSQNILFYNKNNL